MSILSQWFRQRAPIPAPRAPAPRLHAGESDNWGLEANALQYLDGLVTRQSVTAETGAGMSTILFAEKGCEHYAITPSEQEVSAIKEQCRQRGIDDANVRYCLGFSQDILPQLRLPELDLVIIDGGHGFPIPFVDWCYLAPRLKIGGILLIDDIWLWTGTVLADFLRAEWQWELVQTFDKAVAFRKKQAAVITDWGAQPFVMARSNVPTDWKWTCNALHGHIAGLDAALALTERQGDANAETIETLQWVERELLDGVRRIEGICARKIASDGP
ncbi:MAG: class I SAM-dependent methyltransferase [Gemmatimonas sp.]